LSLRVSYLLDRCMWTNQRNFRACQDYFRLQ
jgi:hypothetical protein